jgi:hypothetical protein
MSDYHDQSRGEQDTFDAYLLKNVHRLKRPPVAPDYNNPRQTHLKYPIRKPVLTFGP